LIQRFASGRLSLLLPQGLGLWFRVRTDGLVLGAGFIILNTDLFVLGTNRVVLSASLLGAQALTRSSVSRGTNGLGSNAFEALLNALIDGLYANRFLTHTLLVAIAREGGNGDGHNRQNNYHRK
jgi:hypothetical protein